MKHIQFAMYPLRLPRLTIKMFSGEGELGFVAAFFFFAVLVILGIAANFGYFGPI